MRIHGVVVPRRHVLPPNPIKPPRMLPKAEKEERRVFGPKKLWDRLTSTAEFHTDAFKEIGASETVSRNDLIIAFLKWADRAFWDDQGGRPENPADRKKKLAAFAELLKKDLEESGPASDDDDNW